MAAGHPPPRLQLHERIIFAVDIGPNGAAKMGPLTRLLAARQLIKKFIQLKSRMSVSHEHCEFGKQPDELYRIVDEISLSDHEVTYFDMQSLKDVMPDPNNPAYFLRVIFIYFRSNIIPSLAAPKEFDFFRQNKFCAFDSLYVHDKVADDNRVQEVFDFLNEIDEEKGYCLETRLFRRMNKFIILLLAHGQQRTPHQPAESFLL
ncbi:Component of the BRCA1-A complex [Cladochytrium tenue]|nr:Component of the BRCA1-A complex [Cladochytrium tenue]